MGRLLALVSIAIGWAAAGDAPASREAARGKNNYYLGAGLAASSLVDYNADSATTETAWGGAFWLGYRRHFLPALGLRAGLMAHLGPTQVDRDMQPGDHPFLGGRYETRGEKGTKTEVAAQAQAIIGPFWRIALEPGITFGMGRHSVDSIPTTGSASRVYATRRRYGFLGGILGSSLYLGSRDRYSVTALLSLGPVFGAPETMAFALAAGFAVAFQD